MKLKKIIERGGLVIILSFIMLVSSSFAQDEDSQFKIFKLRNGTILLVNKYTDQVESVWNNSTQDWMPLPTTMPDGSPSPQSVFQMIYNIEKPKPKIKPK